MEDWLIVLTANVAGPEFYGFQFREACARKVFQDVSAHLIGFQEFTKENEPVFNLHGHAFLYGDKLSNDIHNVIAYQEERLALEAHGTVWLSPDGKPEKSWDALVDRNFVWARFRDKVAEKSLLFVNAQFDNVGATARAESMKIVQEFFEEEHPEVTQRIFVGDLNMNVAREHPNWPPEKMAPYHQLCAAGFKDTWTTCFPLRRRPRTFHHYQGERCGEDMYGTYDPDYILVSGMQTHNCRLIKDEYGGVMPSDHYWLISHLQQEKA